MSDKTIHINGHALPSPGGSLAINGEEIDDTILGASWQSRYIGLLSWNLSARAYMKGVAGFQAQIKLDTAEVCAQKIDLTQTANENDVTDFCTARANGGFRVKNPGLRTVGLTLSKIYSSGSLAALLARTPVTITIKPHYGGDSIATGRFVYLGETFSGDAGADEIDELTFGLYVAVGDATPFSWVVGGDSSQGMPSAISELITSFINRTNVRVIYNPAGGSAADSSSGNASFVGDAFVTDLSLSCGMDGNVEFSVELMGDGAIV